MKKMMKKIATTLLCTVAPIALFAQEVDLRSPDEFISVEGEIIGFNGVMIQVATSVGAVSVPASEVICYGTGCLDVIASNDFGLTADAFQDIVAVSQETTPPRADDLTIAFAEPSYGALYDTLTSAFKVASNTVAAEIDENRQITMQSEGGNDTAVISVVDDLTGADIVIDNTTLNGTRSQAFAGPEGWIADAGLPQQMVGMSAYAVMIAPNAGVQRISLSDLAAIFAGEITNWSQIGGADMNVLPLQLPANTILGQEINALVMLPEGKTIAGNVLTMADERGIATSINQFPGSVSIVSADMANPDITVSVAGSCGIAVEPTPFNFVSGDYPLIIPVVASYNTTPETGLVSDLFDFASADIAQDLIAEEGFINYSTRIQPPAKKNARLSSLLGAELDDAQRVAAAEKFQVLFDADRLSPTFVGGAVSDSEAAWNRTMMLDLVTAMADPANEGRQIIFAGQGERANNSQAAVDASAAAASAMQAAFETVAGTVIANNNLRLTSYGFGDVSPSSCLDGQLDGVVSTRVEVWIK